MRLVAIIFCAALFVGLPTISHAQYNDNDQQNPKEYHDEDSQPLAIVADILYPVGYGLEWLVARPMHWLANDSPVAPALPAGRRQRHVTSAAGAYHSRQHDGPADDLVGTAGLVADARARHRPTQPLIRPVAPPAAPPPSEHSAGASLNFRDHANLPRIQGLSSPLNVAYL